jgi:hypothetical protein
MQNIETEEKWNSVALRISSKTRSVAEISRMLNMKPTRSSDKGTLTSPRNPHSKIREESMWILDSDLTDSQPLEAHITKLIGYIEQNITVLKDLLVDCEIDMWCAFASNNGQGGFLLDAKLMKRLTVIPIDIIVSLYPSGTAR